MAKNRRRRPRRTRRRILASRRNLAAARHVQRNVRSLMATFGYNHAKALSIARSLKRNRDRLGDFTLSDEEMAIARAVREAQS